MTKSGQNSTSIVDLVVATINRGKFLEIEAGLAGLSLRLKFLGDLRPAIVIDEDQPTFEGNARKKAETVMKKTGLMTLADDSGLVVPALNGRPGIHSARFAGPSATDEANRKKLLEEMKTLIGDQRRAYFVCVMALAFPSGEGRIFEGRCDGVIAAAPHGQGGFGYDPLFFLPELEKTMGELPLSLKNQISHRGRALKKLCVDSSILKTSL